MKKHDNKMRPSGYVVRVLDEGEIVEIPLMMDDSTRFTGSFDQVWISTDKSKRL